MPPPSSKLAQNIYSPYQELDVLACHESEMDVASLDRLVRGIRGDSAGLYATYGTKMILSKLAIAVSDFILIITFKAGDPTTPTARRTRRVLENCILANDTINKYAFLMDKIVFSLFKDLNMRANAAFNLCSGLPALADFNAALDERLARRSEVMRLYDTLDKRDTSIDDTALHAWAAGYSVILPEAKTQTVSPINTTEMERNHLEAASQLHRHQVLLRQLVPDVTKNDIVRADVKYHKGTLNVVSSRFKTRIRQNEGQQKLVLTMQQGDQLVLVKGRTKKVDGRSVSIASNDKSKALASGTVVSIKTVGKEAPNNSEKTKAMLLYHIIQGKSSILDNPFVQAIWFPGTSPSWVKVIPMPTLGPELLSGKYQLNESQTKAVEAILSPSSNYRAVLIHGPPGTGKTTVIAATTYNLTMQNPKATVWLVAHSNVAVKNIAEKLANIDYTNFKIIVSKDFHHDWHEHLYEKIERNLIRTDSLPPSALAASRILLGARVILCTTSSLLNDRLAPVTRVVPVETLVVDEASQIEIGDYLPVINRYQTTLRKIAFIGDHKQLAPYGHEDIKELQSIFEKGHLRKKAVMLDTQYRMPIPIGKFISSNVYDNKLKSQHDLTDWKVCRFVNVKGSNEKRKGTSWVNELEIETAVAIAGTLHSRGLSFRIITPYDPQKCLLETALKSKKLPSEDKCFNVDSFQGNEADYIIISLVRTAKLGFLREDRRANVMLTRCKKGMVICTNRAFIAGVAKKSLVGKLAKHVGEKAWIDSQQVRFANVNPFS